MLNNTDKYIDMDQVVARVTRDPLMATVNYEAFIDHVTDVLRLVKIPSSYVDKPAVINIVEYKAKIPCAALNIKSVDYIANWDQTAPFEADEALGIIRSNPKYKLYPMVMGTDTLHNHLRDIKYKTGTDRNADVYSYTLNNNMIHTNQETGTLYVTYHTIACNADGLPMIPDNISLIKAIENYIKVQVYSPMVAMGKVNQYSLEKAEQEYAWYIGQAQTSFQGFKNEDDAEAFIRDISRLFIQNTTHRERHQYQNNRELRFRNAN